MKLFVVIIFLVSSCTTKISPPVVSSQKRLPDLALWQEVDDLKLSRAVNNFFLKEKRREKIKNYPEMLPNTRVALFRAEDPEFFYPDRRIEAFLKRCSQMISASCYKIGKDFLDKRKLKDAFKFLEKGCNLKEGESCYLAGVLEFNNKNYTSSEYFYQKGCELGSSNSCYHFVEHFPEKAKYLSDNTIETHDLLCQKGNTASCGRFIFLKFQEGLNASELKDYLNTLDLACQTGEGAACYHMAYIYDQEGDESNALNYLRRSCRKNSAAGCFELARIGYGLSDHRKLLLKKSLELGFNQWDVLELEPRLEFLKKDKNFREMVEVYVLKGPR